MRVTVRVTPYHLAQSVAGSESQVIAVSTWALATLALAWFVFYMYSADNTF